MIAFNLNGDGCSLKAGPSEIPQRRPFVNSSTSKRLQIFVALMHELL